MGDTNIGWTGKVWNSFSGCVKVSDGCTNCYAETIAEQKRGTKAFPNGFDLTLRPHKLYEPGTWKQPQEIFVNSMSDLFLGTVPMDYMKRIFETMFHHDRHTYMILTKRPVPALRIMQELGVLPLPKHIWIGVSVENQRWADERIPQLLVIPTNGVRFLSCEPLLGPVDLWRWFNPLRHLDGMYQHQISRGMFNEHQVASLCKPPDIHWVITGAESGPNRRPVDPDWFRGIRDQCLAAGIPYFHKQGSAFRPGQDRLLDGRTWDGHPNRISAIEQMSGLIDNPNFGRNAAEVAADAAGAQE